MSGLTNPKEHFVGKIIRKGEEDVQRESERRKPHASIVGAHKLTTKKREKKQQQRDFALERGKAVALGTQKSNPPKKKNCA